MSHSKTRLDKNVDRRDFLKTSVVAVVGTVAAGSGTVAASELSTNSKWASAGNTSMRDLDRGL